MADKKVEQLMKGVLKQGSERNLDRKKVVLGLSGGVDSTTAALLLQEQGYEVIGLYFDIWPPEDACAGQTAARRFVENADSQLSCDASQEKINRGQQGDASQERAEGASPEAGLSGRARAEKAAEQLGISFLYRNVSRDFDRAVIGNFCREYAAGRTPNPCIVCNPAVKFRTLLEAAEQLGAYHIATGHYADTCYDEDSGLWYIRKAKNEKKDQSYMLYRLGQEAVSRLLLPLNAVEDKEQVRQLARSRALQNAEAKDSQEICFIEPGDDYKAFLQRRGVTAPKGDFVDVDGNVLGTHQGILHYTIGQRKGLGIALGKPAFVTAIDSETNRVALGDNEDLLRREVFSSGNILAGMDWTELQQGADGKKAEAAIKSIGLGEIGAAAGGGASRGAIQAKIRYAARPADAKLELLPDGRIRTVFAEPQRAATPGQSIVFYRGDLVIGGGFID